MSTYLEVAPYHHHCLPRKNFTLRLTRPAGAWILQTRGLGGRGTFTSFFTYHRTTSHRYTRVSYEEKECKSRMYVKFIVITHWLIALRFDVQYEGIRVRFSFNLIHLQLLIQREIMYFFTHLREFNFRMPRPSSSSSCKMNRFSLVSSLRHVNAFHCLILPRIV